MRVPQWCMLGVTILLLVCEVSISQLCNSFITLIDGFHTLFILMRMALPPPQTANKIRPKLSPLDSPPHASSLPSALSYIPAATPSIGPPPSPQTATDHSTIPNKFSTPHPHHEVASMVNPHELSPSGLSPPALICGLSYTASRTVAVGAFISALLLASLCISCLMEIISFPLEPHPVERPLLLVVVGVVSLLYNMVGLRLHCGQLQSGGAEADVERESKFYLEMNHTALAEEESKGRTEVEGMPDNVHHIQSAGDGSLHNRALVLCNPAASSVLDTDSQTPEQQREEHQHCEVVGSVTDLRAHKYESHSKDSTGVSKDSVCTGHIDHQNANATSVACDLSHPTESPVSSRWSVRLPSVVLIFQSLLTSALALISSLVMLLIGPRCLHGSGPCSLLIYLDPAVAILAVIALIATAAPQVRRYGLLLLQATPPHVCVSDLGQRIASVPGVQGLHDLHIWELADSLMVASVHVHCHAGFASHRCADLMLEVTKVLQSVGVSCCTVQPEFIVCSASSAGSQGDTSPGDNREDPSLAPVLACSFACGNICAGSVCCAPPGEDPCSLLALTAEKTKEVQTLVIENTFNCGFN